MEEAGHMIGKYITPEVLAALLAVLTAIVVTAIMSTKSELKSQLQSCRAEILKLCETINCGEHTSVRSRDVRLSTISR